MCNAIGPRGDLDRVFFDAKPTESWATPRVIDAVVPLLAEGVDVLLCDQPVHALPSPQRFVAARQRESPLAAEPHRAETTLSLGGNGERVAILLI